MYHHSIDKRGLVGGAFEEGAFVKTVRIMIEAVNSALQNASLLRASAEQTSAAESFAANPARVQKVAPRGPSLSIFVDVNYDTAVLQYRNVETRDVIDQIPSETLLQARARDEARRAEADRQAAQPRTEVQTQVQAQPQQASAAPAPSTPTPAPAPEASAPAPRTSAATPQQIAAFSSAAQAGNTNAGFSALSVYA